MKNCPALHTALIVALAGLASPALGQDSVSTTPGTSDALNVYEHDAINRYVVDSVPLTSSWGNSFRIAPVLKANLDNDPLFTSQLLGSIAISADHIPDFTQAPAAFRVWNTSGAGINPVRNTSAGGTINASTFTRQFAVGFSDFASVATNATGALIGQDPTNPDRFYVTRILGATSRVGETEDNTATLTLGSIDASGNLYIRADNFGSTGNPVAGENILRINLAGRGNFINTIYGNGATNAADEAASTTFLINNGATTTNVPVAIPQTLGAASAAILDFANSYRPNGGTGVTTHLASGIGTHRGNPSFSTVNAFGGVGTVASLARPNVATPKVNALNLWSVTSTGTVVATRSATLPTNITDGQGFTANASGNAEFLQYLSQTSFRGGSGQVAVGTDPLTSTTVAAATATDSTGTEFITLARFSGGGVTWTVPAFEGKAVLDGPSGASVGTIAVGTAPISISAPAIDLSGNVYFVAAFQPTSGPVGTALIKAVNTASGYRLERVLASGQSFVGANSTRTYTVERLTLADSDSIASGSFFSGNLLQPRVPGQIPADAADPLSFGGAVVAASISYSNAGVPEQYQAVLLVTPAVIAPPAFCVGDADGSGTVNFDDITAVLGNFGASYPVNQSGLGDANGDDVVNFDDVTAVLGNFGLQCP